MADLPPTTHSDADDDDETPSVRAFIWVLFAFKLATVALIFYHLRTWQTGLLLGATTWYFLPVLALLLGGPILFQIRLRRVRARREALRRAEWMIEQDHAIDDPARTRR
jgi:hypothetical protein